MFSLPQKNCKLYTDASGKIGYGCSFKENWFYDFWDPEFIKRERPSIQYLELFALCAAIVTWSHLLWNTRIIIFCDNKGVRDVVNSMSTGCKNSMVLLHILVLNNLIYNRRVFVKYIETKKNDLADALSRGKIATFKRLARKKIRH